MEWQNLFTPLAINEQDSLPELVISNLESWKTIRVSGDDKKSYLQGQLTCDLASLDEQESTLGAHCDAKGKVWSIFRLFQHGDSYALFQHGSGIESALREIRKYAVFSKVTIELEESVTLGIIGQKSDELIDRLSEQTGNVRAIPDGSAVRISPQRWLLLTSKARAEKLISEYPEALLADERIWDKLDIENAIPRITEGNQNEHIPQAFNLQAIDGISFNKGCYIGQETVARAKYRGTNKRAMYIVRGQRDTSRPSSLQLQRSVGENWRDAGEIFCHFSYPDGTAIGLVILPNNLDSDTRLRLSDQPEYEWQVCDLPYQIEE